MALFERRQLPSRSALSRLLAALDQASVESLRTRFQEDLLARPSFADPGGITDRCGQSWLVADVDGTRKVARQRALPQAESLPSPHRRFDRVGAKGHQGRKRGEIVRTRTVVLQAHTHHFLGTFGGAGNGNYRGELLQAIQVLLGYGKQVGVPAQQIVIRLDGLYGNVAPLSDVLASGLAVVARHKDYHLLDLAGVQAVLAAAPAATCTHPESQMIRTLFDCPLRLELGQHLAPATVRTTEFASAHAVSPTAPSEPAAPVVYGSPQWAKRSFPGGFPGSAFTLQPDGTLRCPADHPLYAQERRPERDGSLRVLYAGRIGFCRCCLLRE